MDNCLICNNINLKQAGEYLKCADCGHEIFVGKLKDDFMINEVLLEDRVRRLDSLDKFKLKTVQRIMIENKFLLDVGSASGKFLNHCKVFFDGCAGVEITEECIRFSREKLGLKIYKDISEIVNMVSVATFWHSLEHIPFTEIVKIFGIIGKKTGKNSKILISVPNSNSLMYKIFKKDFAYYDNRSHAHQFSDDSLDLLMEKFCYKKDSYHFSFAYSAFGYLQSLMNKFNKIHNFLYFYAKRGECFGKNKVELAYLLIYNSILLFLFLIPSLSLVLFDFFFKNKGGVITICYSK